MEFLLLPLKRLAALAVGAVATIACGSTTAAPSEPPHELAPAPTASAAASPPQPAASATATSSGTDAGEPDAAPNAADAAPLPGSEPLPLPAGTTVLHIGDSMAGALGIELNHELGKHDVKGILRFRTASYIPGWAWGKELPLYLAQVQPDLVIITLGTNEVKIPDATQRIGLIKKLIARLDGRPCVWIAPPVWAPEKALYQVIRDNIAPCRYMDTEVVYPDMPRLKDKIHPTIPARKIWAERVVQWLKKERRPTADRPWALAPETGSGN
jgi:lysophospholipase L1-like esterase